MQAQLRSTGLRAENFALTDEPAGDAQLVGYLERHDDDGVVIGSYINGQNPAEPPTPATTAWFNRVLNLVHRHAPTAKIVLIQDPRSALTTIESVLGSP